MKVKNLLLSLLFWVALIALMQSSAFAQGRRNDEGQSRGDSHAVGGGRIPAHGPPP